MYTRILSLTILATISAVYCREWQTLEAPPPNITDYELKGLNALFELANLTTHIPESFLLNKRGAQSVIDQIAVFERQGSKSLLSAGFVSSFLDLIDGDEDVAQLLKAIDMRLTMLKTSSTNYTTVLPQWLGIIDTSLACLNKFEDTIQGVSTSLHKLYIAVQSKVSGESLDMQKAK